MPINLVANLVSLGTLLVFLLVCVSVPIMNYMNPNIERSFKVPYPWLVGTIGAISCFQIMISMDLEVWAYLIFWLTSGFGIYCIYSRRHSLQQKAQGFSFGPIWIDYVGVSLQLLGIVGLAFIFTRANTGGLTWLSMTSRANIIALFTISAASIIFGLWMAISNTNKQKSEVGT